MNFQYAPKIPIFQPLLRGGYHGKIFVENCNTLFMHFSQKNAKGKACKIYNLKGVVMSKRIIKIITFIMAILMFGCIFTACGDNGGGGSSAVPERPIDETKLQLRVKNFEGGAGHEWIVKIRDRFEEKYKNEKIGDLTGIQVEISSDKLGATSALKTSGEHIWFFNNVYYNVNIAQGDFLDISDIVKNDVLEGEGKTIEQKMDADLKAALTAYDGKYYALPSHQGLGGVTYNYNLFKQRGFFFLDDPTQGSIKNVNDARYGFMTSSADRAKKKSTGPDGLYGTDDDGLPSSIEEFKKLCEVMMDRGVKPFICYASSSHYTQMLLQALWSNIEGYDGTKLAVTFDGSTELVKLDSAGKIVTSGGNVATETKTITDANGYLLNRQLSRYQALDFMQYVFKPSTIDSFLSDGSMSSLTNIDAQFDFLASDRSEDVVDVGMLIEGNYWENEALSAGSIDSVNKNFSETAEGKTALDYRFMPMPVQYSGRVTPIGTVGENGITIEDGNKQTFIDCLYYYSFINKYAVGSDANKIKWSKEFLKFCYTNESLVESTLTTGMTFAMDYSLTEAQEAQLSSYKKSLYDIKKYGNIVTPVSASPKFVRNMATFNLGTLSSSNWSSETSYTYPLNAFNAGVSLKDYFESICEYHDADWWQGLN